MFKVDILDAKFHVCERRGLCPICGQNMTQTDRLQEGNHIFIWYKCMSDGCVGQRLQKQSIK